MFPCQFLRNLHGRNYKCLKGNLLGFDMYSHGVTSTAKGRNIPIAPEMSSAPFCAPLSHSLPRPPCALIPCPAPGAESGCPASSLDDDSLPGCGPEGQPPAMVSRGPLCRSVAAQCFGTWVQGLPHCLSFEVCVSRAFLFHLHCQSLLT